MPLLKDLLKVDEEKELIIQNYVGDKVIKGTDYNSHVHQYQILDPETNTLYDHNATVTEHHDGHRTPWHFGDALCTFPEGCRVSVTLRKDGQFPKRIWKRKGFSISSPTS